MRSIGVPILLIAAALLLSGLSACGTVSLTELYPTVTPSFAPTSTVAPAAMPTPTLTPTATSTDTPTAPPTDTPVPTPTPTATHTPASTATVTQTPPPPPVATLNPSGQVGLGLYAEPPDGDLLGAVYQFERLVRHKMRYVLWFQAWGDGDRDFDAERIIAAHRMGLIPVITWEPWARDFQNPAATQPAYALATIAAGDHDAYLRAWAQAARELNRSFIIRFAHEQSTQVGVRSWYPWQGDPEGYRAAFRHIVAIFREENAQTVEFLWSGMWLHESGQLYYPGDDVVDWVGTTVLNHGSEIAAEWAAWRTFDELFAVQYQAAAQWGKPMMITELATAEQGGDKAAWLRDCFSALAPQYPLVRGVLLLEVAQDREWPSINWSVASSPESLAAFRVAVADPHFK